MMFGQSGQVGHHALKSVEVVNSIEQESARTDQKTVKDFQGCPVSVILINAKVINVLLYKLLVSFYIIL